MAVSENEIIQFLEDGYKKNNIESVRGPVSWHGYSVYIPINKMVEGKYPIIGLPQYILEKNGEIKWASMEDAFSIMRAFSSEEIKTEIQRSSCIMF